jgi:hypothetical protein
MLRRGDNRVSMGDSRKCRWSGGRWAFPCSTWLLQFKSDDIGGRESKSKAVWNAIGVIDIVWDWHRSPLGCI